MRTALMVGLGMTIANFGWQALNGHNWPLAVDRSWFQVAACMTMAFVDYSLRRSVGGA